jgi:hypothetical protein
MSASVGFIYKKSITMQGHTFIKKKKQVRPLFQHILVSIIILRDWQLAPYKIGEGQN